MNYPWKYLQVCLVAGSLISVPVTSLADDDKDVSVDERHDTQFEDDKTPDEEHEQVQIEWHDSETENYERVTLIAVYKKEVSGDEKVTLFTGHGDAFTALVQGATLPEGCTNEYRRVTSPKFGPSVEKRIDENAPVGEKDVMLTLVGGDIVCVPDEQLGGSAKHEAVEEDKNPEETVDTTAKTEKVDQSDDEPTIPVKKEL